MDKLSHKSIIFFITLYLSLILGFYFGEDTTGGAYFNYLNQKEIVKDFSSDFLNTFLRTLLSRGFIYLKSITELSIFFLFHLL